MQVKRLLRLIDHRVLGAPSKVYAPDEVKPRWARTARDEVAAVRVEVERLRRRVEALEGERAAAGPGSSASGQDGAQGR